MERYKKCCYNCKHITLQTCKGCDTFGSNTFQNFELRDELAKLESGELLELPCKDGDTVYAVGTFSCQERIESDKTVKRKIFDECMKQSGKCEGCKYALPALEEFVCTQIQIANDGIWICGAKDEMHLASQIFTTKEAAEARLLELQKE